jgi:hypothetical protein
MSPAIEYLKRIRLVRSGNELQISISTRNSINHQICDDAAYL